MAAYHVHTQTLENYGAHCESGKYADGNAYWKFKGGDTYVVSLEGREQDAVAFVLAILENEQSLGWKHYVTGVEAVASIEVNTPSETLQLEYEGEIRYTSPRVSPDKAHNLNF